MLEQIDKMILESTPAGSTPVLQSDLLFIFFFKAQCGLRYNAVDYIYRIMWLTM